VGDHAEQVLVTCEHASNRLPAGLELSRELLDLHIAWDPGALPVARHMARRFGAELWRGKYSRLVVDLNRTVGNRVLMRQISDGHPIPFNRGLSASDRSKRIDRYYRLYRDGVIEAADTLIGTHGRCVHICVHTFTQTLAGRERGNDIGLLHDPNWGIERAVCEELRGHLDHATDYVTWFNRPYSGTADGILPAMRRRYDPEQFVGIELEVNQKYAGDPRELRRIATAIADGLAASPSLALQGS